jgi:hypothetical protein
MHRAGAAAAWAQARCYGASAAIRVWPPPNLPLAAKSAQREEKEEREGESLTGRSHMTVDVGRNLRIFVWVLLPELERKFRPTKVGVSTQIENRVSDLGRVLLRSSAR